MPKARYKQVAIDATPYYHCMSRCVRRSYLCGTDPQGNNYEHRRQWIEDRIIFLGKIFAIDVCAYAVMHNHYHVVLHIDTGKANAWDNSEVIGRWHQLFKGTPLSQRFEKGESLSNLEQEILEQCVQRWRERLQDISWFMRLVNEPIARRANQEDQCSGRFWEGRFKSQALLDDKALAACLAYVELNPIRARMAESPETSDHTSVKKRIQHAQVAHSPNHPNQQPKGLMPFAGNPRQHMPNGLPFRLSDYLELVDWSGRILRADKRGAIAEQLPPILARLQIDPKHWLYTCNHFESRFKGLVGGAFALKRACQRLGYARTPGLNACHLLS